MQFDSSIHSDRPVPALVGNGVLSTTVGRSGYHEPNEWNEASAATQEFVLAGRRLPGPHHRLIPFGTIERTLWIAGEMPRPIESAQSIHTDTAEIRTRILYPSLLESTRTLVLAHKNVFIAETRISNHSPGDLEVFALLRFNFGCRGGVREPQLKVKPSSSNGAVHFEWETADGLGVVTIATEDMAWKTEGDVAVLEAKQLLAPGDEILLRTAITFSDRIEHQPAFSMREMPREFNLHADRWRAAWEESEIITGDDRVDQFRRMALYTILSQATPWSIPPTLSEKHWGAGAFHDEYYPFIGLLSSGHVDRARNVPYFRLAILPAAIMRARAQGALYPWSSTEEGHERDPHGHWYTERFHLGLFVACAWTYWLYERKIEVLEDLYPVMRECARYFETQMIERDERGSLRTKACTDFDESVGEVAGGPFTMGAAAFCLDRAAEAARRLGVDRERRANWDALSKALKQNLPIDLEHRRYRVPGDKSTHSSIAGYVVPFFCDEGSEFAKNSLAMLHAEAKTEFGWKPGFSEVFDGTAWMWTAGHLGMCHSVLSDGESAWETVRRGTLSAGQFLSPNEHVSSDGEPVVPWFTTGCGAWLSALHWMFARVDDSGDYLLPAVPESMSDFSFRGLRLSRGVVAAARVNGGMLTYLSLQTESAMGFTFDLPARFARESWPNGVGRIDDLDSSWRIQVDLTPGTNTFIEMREAAPRSSSER